MKAVLSVCVCGNNPAAAAAGILLHTATCSRADAEAALGLQVKYTLWLRVK